MKLHTRKRFQKPPLASIQLEFEASILMLKRALSARSLAPESAGSSTESDADATGKDDVPPLLPPPKTFHEPHGDDEYVVYSRDFDEIVDACEALKLGSISRLKAKADVLAARTGGPNRARLEVLREPLASERPAITFLIDHSGSMRFEWKIETTLSAIQAIGDFLRDLGIKFEVLAHTSQQWRGGRSRKEWIKAGRPAKPGRLNDLGLIVYKSFARPWPVARPSLAHMLDADSLKENIDGEALIWAYNRLVAKQARRRILIVCSDGAPVDDSTLSTNGPRILEDHLRQVVQDILSSKAVDLFSVGVRHSADRYYPASKTIRTSQEFVDAFIQFVKDALSAGQQA